MESLIELAAGLIILMFLAIPLGFIWKYRAKIKKWLKEPQYGDLSSWKVDGVKRAERKVVEAEWELEDAKDFLAWKKVRKEVEVEGSEQ